jgi:flagellar FliL protein
MAEEPDKNEETEPEAPKPAKLGASKLVAGLLTLNSLMLAGVLATLLLRSGGAKPSASGKEEAHEGTAKTSEKTPAIGPTQKLPDFVVHLRDTDADRYARVSFEIEVSSEPDKERLGAALPRVRDGFISYLSDRTFDELRGSEGLGHTKEELLKLLQKTLPDLPVKGLYITDIVVQ